MKYIYHINLFWIGVVLLLLCFSLIWFVDPCTKKFFEENKGCIKKLPLGILFFPWIQGVCDVKDVDCEPPTWLKLMETSLMFAGAIFLSVPIIIKD